MRASLKDVIRQYITLSVLTGALLTYLGALALRRAEYQYNPLVAAATLIFILFILAYFIEDITNSLIQDVEHA